MLQKYMENFGAHGITVNCVAPSPTETDMQKITLKRKAEFKKLFQLEDLQLLKKLQNYSLVSNRLS